MTCFTPSRDPGDAGRTLSGLIQTRLETAPFERRMRQLQQISSSCLTSCAPPFAGHALQITPEITYRCEQWLPLDELRPHFYQLYRQALKYPPVLASTPFADAVSWAGIVSRFPPFLRHVITPAILFEQLLADAELRTKFLFWSFMPERFYGSGHDRYPQQLQSVGEWLVQRRGRVNNLRCLDAACGDGAGTYGLVRLLLEQGWPPETFTVEGWTLDPLEAWAAAYASLPHDPLHETALRSWSAPVFTHSAQHALLFRQADLMNAADNDDRFDLILCNGLLGGPIINDRRKLEKVIGSLAGRLEPGGVLLVADHFHGGWKQKCPQQELQALFEQNGLIGVAVREGVGALKP